jgi:AcrR family transcriptional regulator
MTSELAAAGAAAPKSAPPQGSPPSPRDAVIDALMRLASDRPWNDIELGDIAEAAGIGLSALRDMFPSKGAILGALGRRIDKQVIEGTTDDLAGEPARERVFDVMMRRIDAMAPYKAALRRISWALRSDPLTLAALNQDALNSQRYMLAAAGIHTEGPLGLLKLQGAVLVLANTMETWFEDDDPTLAKTMARLDRELRRGERILERAEDVRRLAAPLRAFGQALTDARKRMRRPRRSRPGEGEAEDPANAI